MSAVLIKRGLSLALAEDWIGLTERDRRFLPPDNVTADADRLIGVDDIIHGGPGPLQISAQAAGPRVLPTSSPAAMTSDTKRICGNCAGQPGWNREDIITLAQGFQCIYREFTGITKTNYPERPKFKSSIEKVMKRERKKLYRINKDDQLPDISMTGMFELELVDLRHAIGGDHRAQYQGEDPSRSRHTGA